jgi:hypothetical protein
MDKSATTSRAWSQPLRGAIPIPPTLLVIADLEQGNIDDHYFGYRSEIKN